MYKLELESFKIILETIYYIKLIFKVLNYIRGEMDSKCHNQYN